MMSNHFPVSLAEAQEYRGATYVGGATDLMPLFKNHVRDDQELVFLTRIPELHEVTVNESAVSIGAAVTLTEIAESARLRAVLPAVCEAAAVVASPQIRNIATLGGNIMQDRRCIYFNQSEHWRSALPLCFKTGGEVCHQIPNSPVCRAIYYSDVATALLMYGAEVVYLEGGKTVREPLADLIHRHSVANGLSCPEHLPVIVTQFIIPTPEKSERSGFHKYAMRTSIDFPLINFAVRCGDEREAKLFAGAVAPEPVELSKTAELFASDASDDEVLDMCVQELKALAKPIKEACITPARKRDLYLQFAPLLELRK